MKKYMITLAIALSMISANLMAADFGDLLQRMNSRDFTLERDVVTGRGGVYVGELVNPHSETPMFKARDEFRAKMAEAQSAKDDAALSELCDFIIDAMKADVSDETKVWLLEQLGYIGTDKNVSAVAELLKSPSKRIVDGAAVCLGKIPGDAALKALQDNKDVPAAAAALVGRLTPAIPSDSVENIFPLKISKASDAEVDEWLAKFDDLDDWAKEQTLAGLTARDNKKYRDYAIKALNSDSPELQKAGFLALEKMAIADDVDVFVKRLATDRDLTIRICSFVVADGFDDALLKALDASKDAQQFKDLATILANRAVDVRPRIFLKTMAADCPDRLSLLQKAREISTPEDAPSFVASIVQMPRGKDRDAAENLLASLCNKDATPILAMVGQVPEAYNEVLYTLAARTGGDAAKAAVEKLLASSNNAEKALGLRVLNVWADGSFVAKMEELLDSGTLNDAQFTALLRSFIRTVSLPDDEIGIEISRDGKLEKLQKAYKMATRSDEKALVLSRLAANRTEKSFEFAIQCADEKDSKVAEAAHKAIADHVHDTILRKQFPDKAVERIDERFTSKMAFQSMIDGGLGRKQRQNKALIDTVSAVLILQNYMQLQQNMKERNNK
ncbi:MAG: Holliday junction resolvase RuvX [Thermoguttaceae bacterium]|nr:Holliday junction resolvase RuvX [Thermoguttaceae bacterium]